MEEGKMKEESKRKVEGKKVKLAMI